MRLHQICQGCHTFLDTLLSGLTCCLLKVFDGSSKDHMDLNSLGLIHRYAQTPSQGMPPHIKLF